MIDFTQLCDKKLCGCDRKVGYYRPIDLLQQITECVGCGAKLNLYVLMNYMDYDCLFNDEGLPEFTFID